MRLKAEDMQKREGFVKDFFTEHPDEGVPQVQEALKKQFGSGMTPTRVTKIRTQVLRGTDGAGEEAGEEEMQKEDAPRNVTSISSGGSTKGTAEMGRRRGGRPPNKNKSDNQLSRNIAADAEDKALTRCRELLEGIGATNVHITYTIERDLTY